MEIGTTPEPMAAGAWHTLSLAFWYLGLLLAVKIKVAHVSTDSPTTKVLHSGLGYLSP